jgi:hypothetical protein
VRIKYWKEKLKIANKGRKERKKNIRKWEIQ